MRFKLIQYNIWHGTFLDKLIEFINNENPDVVQLQEVGTVGVGFKVEQDLNMFEKIGQDIGMKGEYRRSYWQKYKMTKWDMGIATYSKWPVEEVYSEFYEGNEEIELTDHWLEEDILKIPRMVLGLKISPFGWMFNTHFTWSPEASVTNQQIKAAKKLKEILSKYDEYILSGDMNTPPNSETYNILAEGLMDLTNSELPTLHPTIHRVGFKKLHVDYVFYKGRRLKHISTRIPVIDASDHLPIVTEFY